MKNDVIGLRWVCEPGACPICTPLDGLEWPIDAAPSEQPGSVHPNCLCNFEYILAGEEIHAQSGLDWDAMRQDWLAEWLGAHPPVTERHFLWTDAFARVAGHNPSLYVSQTPAELLANGTYMTDMLIIAGAVEIMVPREHRAPHETAEEWGYE